MPKLFLHMGFHKTGTTSFQTTCFNNLSELRSQGFIYPEFKFVEVLDEKQIFNHSIPMYSLFSSKPENYHVNITWGVKDLVKVNNLYLDYLKKILRNKEDIIISGEGISRLEINELQDLRNFFVKNGYNIIPIAIIRSPYSFHCSILQQIIKSGGYRDITNFIGQMEKIKKIKQVFENDGLVFLPMTKVCNHNKGPVGYLLEWMGVDIQNILVESANEGVSNEYVRVQNILNKQEPVIVKNKKNPNHKKLKMDSSENKFLLTEEEYLKGIKKQCDAENHFFKTELSIEFCDKEIYFSDELTNEAIVKYISNGLLNDIPDQFADLCSKLARKTENKSLNDAYMLMYLANRIRPNGSFIRKKLQEYKEKI